MTTLAELVQPYTPDQVKAQIYAFLVANGVNATSWKSGAVTRTTVAVVSEVIAAFSKLIALVTKGGFLDSAVGGWLTLVAFYVYGVTRDPGSFATGEVKFANASLSTYSGGAGDLVVINPTTKKSYRSIGAWVIGPSSSDVLITMQAVELGSGSTSGPGTITALVSSLSGVALTNDAALVGTDEMKDPELRALCREQTGAVSPNGPRDAYAYLAKTAKMADGTTIGITRVKHKPDGVGGLDLYLATASGTVTGTVGDTTTALGRVDDLLQRLAAPLCVTLRTHSAVALHVTPTVEAWVRSTSGKTDAQIEDDVATAWATYFATIPVGGETFEDPDAGKVYLTGIQAAASAALSEPLRVDLSVPADDVDVAFNEAPVLFGSPSITIHQIAEGA